MSEQNTQYDEIVYSESRTINIGDFESRNIFISLKTKVKKINKKNNTITISDSEKMSLDEFEKDVDKTIVQAKNIVRKRLDREEKKIRIWAEDFAGDYFLRKIENPPK